MNKKSLQGSPVLTKKQHDAKSDVKPDFDSENVKDKEEKKEELEAIAVLSSN